MYRDELLERPRHRDCHEVAGAIPSAISDRATRFTRPANDA